MGRILVIVNKLPIMVVDGSVIASSGGLVPALKEAAIGLKDNKMLWVGYSGNSETTENGDLSLTSEAYHPISISEEMYNLHYNVFSNAILWPVFHYNEITDFPPESYTAYCAVNQLFCDEIVKIHEDGDIIWIHDYHLLLLPSMLREAGITAKIGFFLHVPFPSSEVYRKIPWRKQLLRGILGADVVGFHTYDYCQHFANTVVRVLNIQTKAYQIPVGTRKVKMGVYPVGLNLTRLEAALSSNDVKNKIHEMKRRFANTKLIVGVDRMDYIKGLPQKLMAFEKLLEDNPSLVGNLALVQIAVPSRDTVQHYQDLRKEVEALVGRINAKYSTMSYSAVHYKYDSVPFADLVALYSIADVFLVTSLRDGMNVACQEYIACQEQNKGVLILSEFAGAARCLANAIRINPWDIGSVAQKIKFALSMGAEERSDRHRSLFEYIHSHGAAPWGRSFVSDLMASDDQDDKTLHQQAVVGQAVRTATDPNSRSKLLVVTTSMITSGHINQQTISQMQTGGFCVAIFDPASGSSIIKILEDHDIPIESVHILSEYGCFWKPLSKSQDTWERLVTPTVSNEWYSKVRDVLYHYEVSTPGSVVDAKEFVFSWSWKGCDIFFGESQAQECYVQLANMMSTAQNQVHTVDISLTSSTLEVYPKSLPEQAFNQLFKILGTQHLVIFVGYAPPDSILSHSNVYSLLVHPAVAHNKNISLSAKEVKHVLNQLSGASG